MLRYNKFLPIIILCCCFFQTSFTSVTFLSRLLCYVLLCKYCNYLILNSLFAKVLWNSGVSSQQEHVQSCAVTITASFSTLFYFILFCYRFCNFLCHPHHVLDAPVFCSTVTSEYFKWRMLRCFSPVSICCTATYLLLLMSLIEALLLVLPAKQCKCLHWENNNLFCLFLFVTFPLSFRRSLILCHSKTNDDYPEERHAGGVQDVCKSWGPGWRTDVATGAQTQCRETENRHWEAAQQASPQKQEGIQTGNQPYRPTAVRENKRSLRRSFNIKVQPHHLHLHQKEMSHPSIPPCFFPVYTHKYCIHRVLAFLFKQTIIPCPCMFRSLDLETWDLLQSIITEK